MSKSSQGRERGSADVHERELTKTASAGWRSMKHRTVATLLVLCALWVVGCGVPLTDRQKFKDEIMRDVILTVHLQLLSQGVKSENESLIAARERLKLEIEDAVLRKLQMLAPESGPRAVLASAALTQPPAGAVGKAEGRILRKGKGLPDCKIKLVTMVQSGGLLKVYKEGAEFDTTTDKDGKFAFDALPVGSYKLKWQVPGDTGWIRRLQYKPDVKVEPGKITVAKTVETARGFVSR